MLLLSPSLSISLCRDLWEWRLEFSRVSSSLLSSCHSVSASMKFYGTPHSSAPTSASSSEAPPLGLVDLVTPTSLSTSSTTMLSLVDSSLVLPVRHSSTASSSSTLRVLVDEEVESQQQEVQGRCQEKEHSSFSHLKQR